MSGLPLYTTRPAPGIHTWRRTHPLRPVPKRAVVIAHWPLASPGALGHVLERAYEDLGRSAC